MKKIVSLLILVSLLVFPALIGCTAPALSDLLIPAAKAENQAEDISEDITADDAENISFYLRSLDGLIDNQLYVNSSSFTFDLYAPGAEEIEFYWDDNTQSDVNFEDESVQEMSVSLRNE